MIPLSMCQRPSFLLFICLLFACQPPTTMNHQSKLDIQGHRGCRGLLPENSIPAMLRALELGVTTLELDIVISKDQQVVVSHEPYLSPEICLNTDGNELTGDRTSLNIYQMDYEEIKSYDCGSKFVERFPNQKKVSVFKPLLADLLDETEAYIKENKLASINYNIETKISPKGDNLFHPKPKEVVDLLMGVIEAKGIQDRTTIQSFDVRSLQYAHDQYPEMELVLLVENEDGLEINLDRLGFVPEVYSPYYQFVTTDLVKSCREKGMKLIPWTVNEESDIRQIIEYGVDGIISDYPDRVLAIINEE